MFFFRRLKAAFRQGENNKRYEVLKAIMDATREEYREDNYYTRFTWLVEELLRSDPKFKKNIENFDIEALKCGVSKSIDLIANMRLKEVQNEKNR